MKSSSESSAHCMSSKTITTGFTSARRSKNTRQAEQMRHSRLYEAALLLVHDVLDEHRPELFDRRSTLLVLRDPAAHPHHVGERPVGDPFPIRETAAPVPVRRLRQAVEVLEELPGQPALPDPGDARDRDEVRRTIVSRA